MFALESSGGTCVCAMIYTVCLRPLLVESAVPGKTELGCALCILCSSIYTDLELLG